MEDSAIGPDSLKTARPYRVFCVLPVRSSATGGTKETPGKKKFFPGRDTRKIFFPSGYTWEQGVACKQATSENAYPLAKALPPCHGEGDNSGTREI